ncbi:MAG: DUF2796 domain-containing protein, partial [Pseudomonadota bacterium]
MAIAAGVTPALIHAQHVHGVIDLGVVVEGNTLSVTVDAPLSDVVGFEHAPDNDAQNAELKRVAAILADADAMFGVPAAAGCAIADTAIIAPTYLDSMITAAADHDHEHDEHEHDHDGHDHDKHDHGEHDHD